MSDEDLTAVDYVLGELDDLERARFERAMQDDPALQAQVNELVPLTDRLGSLSPEAWTYAAPERTRREPERRPRRLVRPMLAAAMALAAICLIALVLFAGGAGSPRTVKLTALAGAPAGASARATIDAADHVEMVVEGLRPVDRGHYYELWLMSNATKLVPVAAFRVDSRGDARMSLPLPAPAGRYKFLDVSLQRVGGPGSISSTSVLRGATPG